MSTTFVSPNAPKLHIRLEVAGDLDFENGRLILEEPASTELRLALKRKGSTLSQWISIVSLEAAEAIVKEHIERRQQQIGIAKGGLTGSSATLQQAGVALDFRTQMLAAGVPENEISKAADALAGDKITVTEAANIDALKQAQAATAPIAPTSTIPGLRLSNLGHQE